MYHIGGIAGKQAGETSSSLAPNEILAKLLKGEVTATESQASNFLRKTLPTLIGMNGQTVNNTQGGNTYHLEINTTGNVDSSTYARLKSDMEKMFKTLDSNKAMFRNGNTRNARTLSL